MLFTLVIFADIIAKSTSECLAATKEIQKCGSGTPLIPRQGGGSFSGPDEVNPGTFSVERCTSCKGQLDNYLTKCFDGEAFEYMKSTLQQLQCIQDSGAYCATDYSGIALPEFDCKSKCSAKWAYQLNIVRSKWLAAGMNLSDPTAKAKLEPEGWTPSEVDQKCGEGFLSKNSAYSIAFMPYMYFAMLS